MKHTYRVKGMTCNGCVVSVADSLSGVEGVTAVDVNLQKAEVEIDMEGHIAVKKFSAALPRKYGISEKNTILEIGNREADANIGGGNLNQNPIQKGADSRQLESETESRDKNHTDVATEQKSKLQQLKPLLLIFLYLFAAAFLLHYKDWSTAEAMLDFVGLFYIVFSFFKLLDLKGFPESFRMYDPLAKAVPAYGQVYPFIELALGLMFLMRFQVTAALMATILILGITTVGVTKTLLDKKSIRCACLGTALKLPMTEATFIENAIMLAMAGTMLFLRF